MIRPPVKPFYQGLLSSIRTAVNGYGKKCPVHSLASFASGIGSCPWQPITGCGGYFGKASLAFDSSHSKKRDRGVVTSRIQRQDSHWLCIMATAPLRIEHAKLNIVAYTAKGREK